MRMKRNSSGESLAGGHMESEESDSDQPLDLAALKRARLHDPGTISMFGSIGGRKAEDEDALATAEKVRTLFDLPSTEKIITGIARESCSNSRISRMVSKECHDTRIYASYRTTHLLLCPTPQNKCIYP
jgi:hypothetical protein